MRNTKVTGMDIIGSFKEKASGKNLSVVLPEGRDERIIQAARRLKDEDIVLYLGEGTVRNYVSSILSKLNVRNRAEAAAYAVEHNLKDYL